jgi:hypothetical protein
MIILHGLDEARHIELDHLVFRQVLPALSPAEFADAQRIYGQMMAQNHALGERYAAVAREAFGGIDYLEGNEAARTQLAFTQTLAQCTLSKREFPMADAALSDAQRAELLAFTGVDAIHPVESGQ